jgi:hypothetical protein
LVNAVKYFLCIMSSLRERLDKKKKQYLQAAKGFGKKDSKEDKNAPEAADEPEEASVKSDANVETPQRPSKPTSSNAATPTAAPKDSPQVARELKKEEKEVWKYEGEYNESGEVLFSFPSPSDSLERKSILYLFAYFPT